MARAREYIKIISTLMTSLKQGFLSDIKTYIGRVPDGEFFDNWHMDRLFLCLALRKKSPNFTHTLM